jgi:hypothetical protein
MRDRSPFLVGAMWLLQGIAAIFIFLAVGTFAMGLWRLLPFAGGILFYGPVTLQLESFPRQLGQAVANLFGPVMWGALGGLCLAASKRIRVHVNVARQAADPRAPVVYLRSFHVDKRLARRPLAIGRVVSFHTEEEQLVEALREIGPVVAIGRPGERLPRLGARRVYAGDAEWQEQILSWFAGASLVVIYVPSKPTEGLAWEIEQSLSVVPLDRVVFLISKDRDSLSWLNRKLQDRGLSTVVVSRRRRTPYRSRISGIAYFNDGRPEFRALVKPRFLNRPLLSPLVPVFRSAFQPLTTRITGSWRPLAPGFGDAVIAAVWITFGLFVVAVAVGMRRSAPLEREIMICGNRLLNQLPAEARELAQNRDTALTGWMQARIQSGLRYIPDDVALTRADIVAQLLAHAPSAACGAIADGTIEQAALDKILNELGRRKPALLETWCTSQEKPLLAALDPTHLQAFPVSQADATAAFNQLFEGLSPENQARYRRVTESYEHSSAEDHCWFARTLFDGINRVREPSRSKLARIALGQDVEK